MFLMHLSIMRKRLTGGLLFFFVVKELAHVGAEIVAVHGVGALEGHALLPALQLLLPSALFGTAALPQVLFAQAAVAGDEDDVEDREEGQNAQKRDDPALAENLRDPAREIGIARQLDGGAVDQLAGAVEGVADADAHLTSPRTVPAPMGARSVSL